MVRHRDPDGGHNKHVVPTDLWLLTITDQSVNENGKKIIWYIARECSEESQSTYNSIGLVEWLLSNDSLAGIAREKAIWKIIPIANPHNVALNELQPGTLKADWNKPDAELMSNNHEAVIFIRDEMMAWKNSGRSVDFAVRAHAPFPFYTWFPNAGYDMEITKIAHEEAAKYDVNFNMSGDVNAMTENRWTTWVNKKFELEGKVPCYLTEAGIFNTKENSDNKSVFMYHHDFVRNGEISGIIISRYLGFKK